ncbi:hypothetical protein KVC60_01695 [Helicobacter pylori]|uniref:hypothetical protein n=1 Tax=Helicobacter pylori TaxID=210 RepID=UPI00165C0EEF|nr:hypothetical protein [Helicobacter pylori]WQS21041.1 hypothetical protein KVC60_01695 [Helicobacter pylori]WQS30381.1 hypothetical protein KVE56_01695 [Helicobacter pylori]
MKAFLILFFFVAIVVFVGSAILSALQEAAERLGRAFSIPIYILLIGILIAILYKIISN